MVLQLATFGATPHDPKNSLVSQSLAKAPEGSESGDKGCLRRPIAALSRFQSAALKLGYLLV
jgi:hypothetical protein